MAGSPSWRAGGEFSPAISGPGVEWGKNSGVDKNRPCCELTLMATERADFVSYTHDLGIGDTTKSPVLPLYSDDQIGVAITQLKGMVETDAQSETQAALKTCAR